ncbi:DUF4942 domain-containing protein [Sphingobium sp. B11D3A]|uniref:DUF4942 domain-containing protein n=1 Tax=Sphingobium sp. B11D3A TaxID=2940574 RepID=UPI00222522E1|nr:DUF4942 domain-containing protein [Sphingobium sp. B11D3A]MCW2393520.1 protein-L-isoaspartate O-methyltransferase [Sphingobium sp. B11D3A]
MHHLKIERPDASAQPNGGNLPALLANIEDLTKGRDRAIALWLDAYDTLHANIDAAAAASIGGKIALHAPSRDRYDSSERDVTIAFLATGGASYRDRDTSKRIEFTARQQFERTVTHEVDRRCWSNLLEKLGFDALLDRQAREEFRDSLKDEPPAFTPENCSATFTSIWGNRRDMYLRGIANVFMKMDRRFRSHDAFEIGSRLILERAMRTESWGGWESYQRRDTLHDVERIFRELDGLPPIGPNQAIGIVHQVETAKRTGGLPRLVEGDYFRVRVFQNGNLHLWFERKDLLKQINALLLEYYKPIEGDVGTGPSYEAGPLYHATPAKKFGAFNSSQEVADRVIGLAAIREGDRVLEPSAGTGVLACAARTKGADVSCIEIQPGLAHELRVVHGFDDVTTIDFLSVMPTETFDRIVMNPPFDRGRDCDHVRHAYQFLKPGGVLVAVMSARAEFASDARHKALHDLLPRDPWRRAQCWHELPERSFAHAGTNVNTVMLVIRKPSG